MISPISVISEKPLPISPSVYRHVHDLKSTGARGYIGNRFSLITLTELTDACRRGGHSGGGGRLTITGSNRS
jgi:hypothetical protein